MISPCSLDDAAAMIRAQIYREWGVAIVKGRTECLLALSECSVPDGSPRSARDLRETRRLRMEQ